MNVEDLLNRFQRLLRARRRAASKRHCTECRVNHHRVQRWSVFEDGYYFLLCTKCVRRLIQ